jgi:hypothetical protein
VAALLVEGGALGEHYRRAKADGSDLVHLRRRVHFDPGEQRVGMRAHPVLF